MTMTSRTVRRREREQTTTRTFDIRLIIAALFTAYGVTLTVLGLAATTADLEKAAGFNINLWSGLGMLVFSGAVALWALFRPIRVETTASTD